MLIGASGTAPSDLAGERMVGKPKMYPINEIKAYDKTTIRRPIIACWSLFLAFSRACLSPPEVSQVNEP